MDLVEQDAVGHQRDLRRIRHFVGEAHLVSDGSAEFDVQLLGDALGDRASGESARLGVRDVRATEFETDLRQLRGLARSGRTGDDDDLIVADGIGDLIPRGADGQFRGIGDHEIG